MPQVLNAALDICTNFQVKCFYKHRLVTICRDKYSRMLTNTLLKMVALENIFWNPPKI